MKELYEIDWMIKMFDVLDKWNECPKACNEKCYECHELVRDLIEEVTE
jgi:hypothetical protein